MGVLRKALSFFQTAKTVDAGKTIEYWYHLEDCDSGSIKASYTVGTKEEIHYNLGNFGVEDGDEFLFQFKNATLEELTHWALSTEMNIELIDDHNHSNRWIPTFVGVLDHIEEKEYKLQRGGTQYWTLAIDYPD